MEIMPNCQFAAREVIFKQGEEPDGVYLICDGSVQVDRVINDVMTPIAQMGKGEVFGELAIIDSSARNATVTAVEETWAHKFKPEQFLSRLKELDPMMYHVFYSLSLNIRTLNHQLDKSKEEVARLQKVISSHNSS